LKDVLLNLFSRDSFLRSLKNHIITFSALVSRTAIDDRLTTEEGISLSDSYILNLEEAKNVDEVRQIAREMLYTFTKRVYDLEGKKYSETVNKCREYTYRNIFNDITHEDVANFVVLSPSYLSTLFKKRSKFLNKNHVPFLVRINILKRERDWPIIYV
jgi:YesN/AraC family two-component response regulator